MRITMLVLVLAGAAEGQLPNGTIAGVVRDPAQAGVSGARVKVTNLATNLGREQSSTEQGGYSFPALAPGEYEISVEAPRFQRVLRRATVETGMTVRVDFDLQLGTVTESVSVESASPQIQYDSHSVGGTITAGDIGNLPLNGRNFLELAKLEPGVQAPTHTSGNRMLIPVYAPLPGNLTVAQNLRVFGLVYGVRDLSRRIEAVLDRFDLARFRDVKCGVLSSGEQTRVSLAKALLNGPRVLLLDEPTASLDPASARDIRGYIREFAASGDCGVLWTSHNMYEVAEVCHRVLFLSHGKALLEGDPRSLPREHGKENLEELFITVAREPLTLERT